MRDHLMLLLDAPMSAWGAEIIDARGGVRDFPGRSNLTGLIANALGWDRSEGGRHDALQARMRVAAVRVREGATLRDFQTAKLEANDKGWTTRGRREDRAGGAATYDSPHIRERDWQADVATLIALRLEPADEAPTLDDVSAALDRPERPLFLGRKPAAPAGRIVMARRTAATAFAALEATIAQTPGLPFERIRHGVGPRPLRAQWDPGEGPASGAIEGIAVDLCDERRWALGAHGGMRQVFQGLLRRGQDVTSQVAS